MPQPPFVFPADSSDEEEVGETIELLRASLPDTSNVTGSVFDQHMYSSAFDTTVYFKSVGFSDVLQRPCPAFLLCALVYLSMRAF